MFVCTAYILLTCNKMQNDAFWVQPRAVPKSFRSIRNIDTAEFERSVRRSRLFTSPDPTVDGYADQLERIVVAELDRVAPLRHCRRRPSKPTRWLSQDAVNAKRDRRCLERRWRRTKSDADRIACRQACRRANKLINTSRRDFYRGQLESAVDSRDRWKLTQSPPSLLGFTVRQN